MDSLLAVPDGLHTLPVVNAASRLILSCSLITAACGDDGPAETTEGTGSTGTDTGSSGGPTTASGDSSSSASSSSSSSSSGTTAADETATDTGTETGGAELPPRIQHIVDALTMGMYECPERSWPGIEAAMRGSQVMLVSQSDDIAYLWNDQSLPMEERPGVTLIEGSELSVDWFGFFNVGTWNGAPTIGISLDITGMLNPLLMPWHDDFAISLAFHEGFHFLSGQLEWMLEPGRRSGPYPEQWEQRYLRAELAYTLQAQLLGLPAVALGPAAFWQQRLLSEQTAAMQDIASTDIYEGTANYVESRMSAVFELGCEASEEALVQTVADHLDEWVSIVGYDGGSEPYELGVLAGNLMDYEGLAPGWKSSVQGGVTPVDELVSGVAPMVTPDDAALQAEVQGVIDARNASVGMEVEPLLARIASDQNYRVALPFSWLAGSFSTTGFYYLADDPAEPEVILEFSALLESPGGVQVDVSQTVFDSIPSPCTIVGGSYVVATIPIADVSEPMPGEFTGMTSALTFVDYPATIVDDGAGLPWLCPGMGAFAPAGEEPVVGVVSGEGRPHIVVR